jgi:hypothetical protein
MPFKSLEKKKEYQREYHKEHPDKEYQREYFQTHKEKWKKYRITHKEYYKNYQKQCYKQNREVLNEYNKQYRRKHSLGYHNKRISGLNKRPYTNYCEICGKFQPKKLNYHHWNDSNPSMGIWVCYQCHILVEFIEKGKFVKADRLYHALKLSIEKSFGNQP